jgi:hypothetical protein
MPSWRNGRRASIELRGSETRNSGLVQTFVSSGAKWTCVTRVNRTKYAKCPVAAISAKKRSFRSIFIGIDGNS